MGHLSAKYAFNHIRLNPYVRCGSNFNCFLNKSDNCLWLAAERYRIASYSVVARLPLDSLVPSPYFASTSRDNRQPERTKNCISHRSNANINKWISFADSELWTIYGTRMHCCYIFDTCDPANQKTVNAGMPVRCRRSIEIESGRSLWTLLMRHLSTRRIHGNELCKCNGWRRMIWDTAADQDNMRMMECINEWLPIIFLVCDSRRILCVPFHSRDAHTAATPSPQRRKRFARM